MIVIAFTVLCLTYFFMRSRPWRYKTFTSPGLCLPFIGHSYKLMNKVIKNDPVNGIWNLYRSHQRDGMLYFKSFGFNNIWIGDFKTVKYIFNHADGNSRSDPALLFFFKQTRQLIVVKRKGLQSEPDSRIHRCLPRHVRPTQFLSQKKEVWT